MDLVPYAVPFFLLAIVLEYAWGRARGNDTYRLNDSINSLSCGILSTTIKLLGDVSYNLDDPKTAIDWYPRDIERATPEAQGDDYLDGGEGSDSLAGAGGHDTILLPMDQVKLQACRCASDCLGEAPCKGDDSRRRRPLDLR